MKGEIEYMVDLESSRQDLYAEKLKNGRRDQALLLLGLRLGDLLRVAEDINISQTHVSFTSGGMGYKYPLGV